MLGGSSMVHSEQRSLLEGLPQQDHGDMGRNELKELISRIMKMTKELGAGDDGLIQEVIEEASTTTAIQAQQSIYTPSPQQHVQSPAI